MVTINRYDPHKQKFVGIRIVYEYKGIIKPKSLRTAALRSLFPWPEMAHHYHMHRQRERKIFISLSHTFNPLSLGRRFISWMTICSAENSITVAEMETRYWYLFLPLADVWLKNKNSNTCYFYDV